MGTTQLIVWAVVIALVFWAIGAYNRLVRLRNAITNAFAQIDVQLKRRYDLIPNLVETAKKYLSHERETLEAVIAARNQAQAAQTSARAAPTTAAAIGALATAETVLGGALGRLFAVAEAYPELKADQTIRDLNEELSSTENKVAFARQAFNDAVLDFNNAAQQFPTNLVAGVFSFKEAAVLKATESEEERKTLRIDMK
jgi:LemA protein